MRQKALARIAASTSTGAVATNHKLVPFIVVLATILQLVNPYKGWMALIVVFGGVWLVAWVWVRSLKRNLKLIREMRMGWVQVGDRLEERFIIINKSWIPAPWLEIVDRSTLPGHQASRVTAVGGDTENSWTIKTACTRRGAFILGPTCLRASDPFGLYTITLDYPGSSNMMVLPPIVPLPSIEVAPGGRATEGRRRIGAFERTINAAGVREYENGDGLSRVHWRTSARRDQLFVRLFESTLSSDWWIILDLDQSAQAGDEQASTVEHGVILAASLADRGLQTRRAVGLLSSGASMTWLPPRQGAGQRWEILRALAVAEEGKRPLSHVLTQIRPSLKGISSLIVITPAVTGEWIESLIPLLWRGIVPTVLLLDPATFGAGKSAASTASVLLNLGITHYVISRDLLDRPESRPGQGVSEWKISPQGRAIMKNRPHDTSWKRMTDG